MKRDKQEESGLVINPYPFKTHFKARRRAILITHKAYPKLKK